MIFPTDQLPRRCRRPTTHVAKPEIYTAFPRRRSGRLQATDVALWNEQILHALHIHSDSGKQTLFTAWTLRAPDRWSMLLYLIDLQLQVRQPSKPETDAFVFLTKSPWERWRLIFLSFAVY